jgi:hypothetical protein
MWRRVAGARRRMAGALLLAAVAASCAAVFRDAQQPR